MLPSGPTMGPLLVLAKELSGVVHLMCCAAGPATVLREVWAASCPYIGHWIVTGGKVGVGVMVGVGVSVGTEPVDTKLMASTPLADKPKTLPSKYKIGE